MKRLAVFLMFVYAALPLWGQGSVTIFGTVTDSAGAVVPNAQIAVTDTLTGAVRNINSDASGEYVAKQLPVGVYSVKGQAAGFKMFEVTNIHVQVMENRRVDVRLEIGELSQSIAVSAAVAQVELRSGQISQVVDSARVLEMPLNGRNALDLQALIPGWTGYSTDQAQNGSYSVNGSNVRSNNFTLDGVSNNDAFFNYSAPLPNPDALQEFTMTTNSYPADQGRNAGIVVSAVTKSGTNQFHGSLFEFLRNSELNARSYGAPTTPPFRRNQFGGTFGGPVLLPKLYNGRNRTFFFFSYQGTRERSSANAVQVTEPTAAQRAGDFSSYLSLGKPVIIKDPTTGGPFSGNIIPTSRISPIALNFLKAYEPLPNSPNSQYIYPAIGANNDDQYTIKVDHQVTSANRATFRLIRDYDPNLSQIGNTPAMLTQLNYINWNLGATDIHVFSPTTLNTLTYARIDIYRHQTPAYNGPHPTWADMGSQAVLAQMPESEYGFSTNVTNYFNAAQRIPLQQLRITHEITDQLGLTRGPHQLRIGFEYRKNHVDRSEFAGYPGFTFNGTFTTDSAADFLLGLPKTFTQSSPNNLWNPAGNEYSAYVQDDWRVTKRLTLNLGIRWDPFIPEDTPDRMAVTFIPGFQSTIFPKAPAGLAFEQDPGIPPTTIHSRYKNFGPRFGFAWDPFGTGKLSIRGGYGMFFGQLALQDSDSGIGPATTLAVSIDSPVGGLANPYLNYPGGFPFPYNPPNASQRATYVFPTLMSLQLYAPDYRDSIVQSWNLSLQRQFGQSTIVTAAYVANKGNHLEGDKYTSASTNYNQAQPTATVPGLASVQARRLYPTQYSTINLNTSFGNSLFQSLQVTVNKRMSKGLSILGTYTFANGLNDIGPSDVLSIHQFERQRFGVKNRLVTSFVWELPKLSHQPAIVRYVAGGWETTGILTFQSGTYLTIGAGLDNNNNGQTSERADLVGNPFLDRGRANAAVRAQYFNIQAFTTNSLATSPSGIGTSGKGIIEGPGSMNADLGLFKNFQILEKVRLQFRAEAFNSTNHVNLPNPTTALNSANFGKSIGASGTQRVAQMALKLSF